MVTQLYTTAPAVGAFTKLNLLRDVQGISVNALPAWVENWRETGLVTIAADAQTIETVSNNPASGADLIVTTGGTGVHPSDQTPEATADVIERAVPGFGEAMRAASLQVTPMAMLSRGVSGIAGRTLIVNFPGSPKGVGRLFRVIAPVLEQAGQTLRGASSHGNGRAGRWRSGACREAAGRSPRRARPWTRWARSSSGTSRRVRC